MSTLQEGLAQSFRWIEATVQRLVAPWQKLSPWKSREIESATVQARAQLEACKLTERYSYKQEISRNPSSESTGPPTGHIEVTVPYDGHDYFTRQACADVTRGMHASPDNPVTEVLIGHLLLTNHNGTDLGSALSLHDKHGSIPLQVPVPGDVAAYDVSRLSDDRQACVISYDYTPDQDKVRLIPIRVDADLLDPDSVDLPSLNLMIDPSRIDDVPSRITQQVNFRPHLLLCLRVVLNVHNEVVTKSLKAKVGKVALHWPTITSVRAIHLEVGDDPKPITYNPEKRTLEWSDVPMKAVASTGNGNFQSYQSEPMYLFINQPGELYEQEELDGTVEVEILGCLLSGLDARLYNATGALVRSMPPGLTSEVVNDFSLILDDAFAKRTLSPYQHLYFDEVIPDEMRIADIKTALKDRGFEVAEKRFTDSKDRRFLQAHRSEGPDLMELWLFIEGRRYETKRRNQIPGGHSFESIFESGELKVFICGTLPRDSRELTHEMNMLQKALRERFERLRARR